MQDTVEIDTAPSIKMMVYASLFSALMAAGAYIAIPIGPVPIVLQNMFVLMAALLLGVRWGMAAILLYLFMGACGLPVFAGGTGGIGRLFGPTGGYLLGYIPAVLITALISRNRLPINAHGLRPTTSNESFDMAMPINSFRINTHGSQRTTHNESSHKIVKPNSLPINIIAMTTGTLIVYMAGVPWLKVATGMTWGKAVGVGMFPFLVGDLAKIVAGSLLALKLYPMLKRDA